MIYYERLVDGTLYDTSIADCPRNRCSTNCQGPDCAERVDYTVVVDTPPRIVGDNRTALCDDVETVYLTEAQTDVSYRFYSCREAFEEWKP